MASIRSRIGGYMTESETIETLKNIALRYKHLEKVSTAFDIAEQALEKRTAKKVAKQQWMETKCSCGYVFSKDHGDGYYSIPYENMTKYCLNCGQRLDWREDNEVD